MSARASRLRAGWLCSASSSSSPWLTGRRRARVSANQQDDDFARAVREWTTAPEFLSPLVDHLPRVPGDPVARRTCSATTSARRRS